MNGSTRIFYAALAIIILCFILISALLPSLFESVSEQVISIKKVSVLSSKIYDVQKYKAQAAYPSTRPQEPTELSKNENCV